MDYRHFLCILACCSFPRNEYEYGAEDKTRVRQKRSAPLHGNGKMRNGRPPHRLGVDRPGLRSLFHHLLIMQHEAMFSLYYFHHFTSQGLIFPHLGSKENITHLVRFL